MCEGHGVSYRGSHTREELRPLSRLNSAPFRGSSGSTVPVITQQFQGQGASGQRENFYCLRTK